MKCPKCGKEAGTNDKFCRACGAAWRSKPIRKIAWAILIVLGALIVMAMIIPWFSNYTSPDIIARRVVQSDIQNARIALDAYFTDHNRYPDALGKGKKEALFYPSDDVTFVYEQLEHGNKYRLTFSHKDGDREYKCGSGDPAVYWRYKKEPDAKWQAL